jgi:predicted MFS family arabinose efflux permease
MNKGIIIAVVIVAVIVWFLFNHASSTVAKINTSNKATYTTGTAVSSAVTNLAPALGQFLSGLATQNTPTYSSSTYYTDSLPPASYSAGSDSAYSTDSFDPSDPLAGSLFGNIA